MPGKRAVHLPLPPKGRLRQYLLRFMGRAHSQQISRPIYLHQRLLLKGSTVNPRAGACQPASLSSAGIFPPRAPPLCTGRHGA